MNPKIDYQLQLTPNADDATIATAVNAMQWQDLYSPTVLAWLGAGGRLAKVEGWLAASAASESPAVQALRNALRVLLLSVGNPATSIDLTPGSEHRDLLAFAVQAGAIDQTDADALLAKAKTGNDVTEADVAAHRQARALTAAKDAAMVALASFEGALRNAINAAESIDAIPEVPTP